VGDLGSRKGGKRGEKKKKRGDYPSVSKDKEK
jgi:hypothetical protein